MYGLVPTPLFTVTSLCSCPNGRATCGRAWCGQSSPWHYHCSSPTEPCVWGCDRWPWIGLRSGQIWRRPGRVVGAPNVKVTSMPFPHPVGDDIEKKTEARSLWMLRLNLRRPSRDDWESMRCICMLCPNILDIKGFTTASDTGFLFCHAMQVTRKSATQRRLRPCQAGHSSFTLITCYSCTSWQSVADIFKKT